VSLTEVLCLSVTSMGKLGIEMPNRNLLVMEWAYISLSLSVCGKFASGADSFLKSPAKVR